MIEICKARKTDLEAIIQIQEEGRLSFWSKDNYLNELNRKESVILTAKKNNKVIGFLIARLIINIFDLPNNSKISNKNEAELYNIAVKNSFHRKGIGSALLKKFIDITKNYKVETIWLEVRESNNEAIEFYKKNGFKPAYARKNFYASPAENALVMKAESENKT